MDTITLTVTRDEYVLLVKRFEMSLEKDAQRVDDIDSLDSEFALLRKLIGLQET